MELDKLKRAKELMHLIERHSGICDELTVKIKHIKKLSGNNLKLQVNDYYYENLCKVTARFEHVIDKKHILKQLEHELYVNGNLVKKYRLEFKVL